eukprot:TRINITY_DN49551_c0_g1_i1.p1 TRINITY_DN49551_c0_g1~~TRINITY_DN49551_c0_g1_i1.p1  ORF type:complete len:545 (+),score=56.38 TRINITY_DN49551_c0_g1_i1:201-1637(+)
MMDRNTGRSRGFGFCTFESADAVAAVLSMPHTIDGKGVECRACLSKAETRQAENTGWYGPPAAPAQQVLGNYGPPQGSIPRGVSQRPIENKVFLGGLAPTTTSESLNEYMSQFGDPDCIVMMDRSTGRSRGFGFCTFMDAEQTMAVLSVGTPGKTPGSVDHVIDGKVVSVKACEEKPSFGYESKPSFYQGGGPPTSVPQRARPPYSPSTTTPALSTSGAPGVEAFTQALAGLAGLAGSTPSSGGTIRPQMITPYGDQGMTFAPCRIFVGGLPQTCDDSKLHIFFSQFGTLTDAKVMIDRSTMRSRGFGYVSFADEAAMEAALANADHNAIDDKWVEVKRCEERGSASLGGRSSSAGVGPPMASGPSTAIVNPAAATPPPNNNASTAGIADMLRNVAAVSAGAAGNAGNAGTSGAADNAGAVELGVAVQLGALLGGLQQAVQQDPVAFLAALVSPVLQQAQGRAPTQGETATKPRLSPY